MHRIKAYHRPKTMQEALQILSRPNINTTIIGGGTYTTPYMNEMVDEVLDLQALDLNEINYTAQGVSLGAMVRLQDIVLDERAPQLLKDAARREVPNTLRSAATLGGLVASPHRDSELLAALLVFEAKVHIETIGDKKTIALAEFIRDVPAALGGGIITAVSLETLGSTASERVARTPADKPIVAALARKDNNDNILMALCGVANTPVLVDPDNVKAAVSPPNDFRGSKEYRRQMAAVLAKRVIAQVSEAS